MNAKDTQVLCNWIAGGASAAEIEGLSRFGLVDNERFSERARRRFLLICEWSNFRMSSAAQEKFWLLHGRNAFYRRMNRARALARAYGCNLGSFVY